jgi:hypothetical protein
VREGLEASGFALLSSDGAAELLRNSPVKPKRPRFLDERSIVSLDVAQAQGDTKADME